MSADRTLKLMAEIAETVRDLRLAMLRLKTIVACIAICDSALRQRVNSGKDEQGRGKISETSDPACVLHRQLTSDYAKTQVLILRYRIKIIQLKFAISCLHDAKISLPRPDGSASDTQIPTEGRSPWAMLDKSDTRVTSGKASDTDRNLVNVQSEVEVQVCAGDKSTAGDSDSVAGLPNAAIGGVGTYLVNVDVMRKPSNATQPGAMNRRSGRDCRRRTQSCVRSLLSMAKAPTAFSPPPISGAIPGVYFEEGQRCPSSLSALRNKAVGEVAIHHESIGLGWSTFILRVTQCMRGHNSTIHRPQKAKGMGGHNSPTITNRVTQCTRGHNSSTGSDTTDRRFKDIFAAPNSVIPGVRLRPCREGSGFQSGVGATRFTVRSAKDRVLKYNM